jgi:hypothetical protein
MSKFHEEFFGNKTPEHDELMVWLHRNIESIKEKLTPNKAEEWDDIETEVLCKSRNDFIIGYADAVLTKMGSPTNWGRTSGERIVFEIKPKIDSWGGPLRQIKTYMDILKIQHTPFQQDADRYNTQGYIITYTELSDDVKNIFKKENVEIITVKRTLK